MKSEVDLSMGAFWQRMLLKSTSVTNGISAACERRGDSAERLLWCAKTNPVEWRRSELIVRREFRVGDDEPQSVSTNIDVAGESVVQRSADIESANRMEDSRDPAPAMIRDSSDYLVFPRTLFAATVNSQRCHGTSVHARVRQQFNQLMGLKRLGNSQPYPAQRIVGNQG